MPSVTTCERPEAFDDGSSQLLLGGVVDMACEPVAVISGSPQVRLVRCHNFRQRIQLYRVTVRKAYGYAPVLDVIEFIGSRQDLYPWLISVVSAEECAEHHRAMVIVIAYAVNHCHLRVLGQCQVN